MKTKMMQTKKHTLLWFAAGLLLCLLVLLVVWSGLSEKTFITDPDSISEAADAVMDCIHNGNWENLKQMTSGTPSLMPAAGEDHSAEKMIYDAYLKSLRWTCPEQYQIRNGSVTQTVSLTCLDIVGVTKAMEEILMETAADTPGAENRPQMFRTAAELVLSGDAPVMHREIILTFLREENHWYVAPTGDLQALLSGFISH